ncbi:MAG TPA: YbaK/EbsC family protein [Gaiella sp.]|jgi:Ala-tRNA(Pro) deacylase
MAGTGSVTTLTRALDEAGIAYEVLEHPRTDTAAAEAAALGLEQDEVAKTIVVSGTAGNVRVVVPASERIDMHKLRELLDAGKEAHLLAEGDLAREYPEFELGAVPPVGGRDDAVIVDRRVAERSAVVLEAGTHDHSVRLATADLVALTHARIADVCSD